MAMILLTRIRQSLSGRRGFALFIAVIFTSVMLTFGLSLASIGYKQTLIASSALDSQYAFYAADAGLECILYADQQSNAFDYAGHDAGNPPALISCDNVPATLGSYSYNALVANRLIMTQRLSLDGGAHCADVTISKLNPTMTPGMGEFYTYVYALGYSAPCATVTAGGGRFASRGLSAHY